MKSVRSSLRQLSRSPSPELHGYRKRTLQRLNGAVSEIERERKQKGWRRKEGMEKKEEEEVVNVVEDPKLPQRTMEGQRDSVYGGCLSSFSLEYTRITALLSPAVTLEHCLTLLLCDASFDPTLNSQAGLVCKRFSVF
ncbi:hypothetical protein PAMP_002577 [Pampus punctatissimus]